MKTVLATYIFYILFLVLWLIGEVRCIYKMCTCNWEPIGKAEILYTAGAFTPLGGAIGFFNIYDN